MASLTVGYVSGFIAAGVFLTQHLVPTAIGLVLVGLLSEEHSIVSWSVVSRLLHGSHWSLLLDSDSSASTAVSRRIQFISWFQPVVLSLVGIASIVTPLGLYDELSPNNEPTLVPFRYSPDTTPFGGATSSRAAYKPTRICYETVVGCPGAPPAAEFEELDDIEAYSVWPGNIDLFTSGNVSATVSSLFDIEWRIFRESHQISYNVRGSAYSQAVYRHLFKFIVKQDITIVEGLIVDTETGRIGFRNHTVPIGNAMDAEWTEDILFIEPETQCVNTNTTLEYELSESGHYDTALKSISSIALVDHGGFTNLSQVEPDVDSTDFQEDPRLYDRAYSLAWHYNMLTMLYLNVTTNGSDGRTAWSYLDSHLGKRFELGAVDSTFMIPNVLQTTFVYGRAFLMPSWPGGKFVNFSSGNPPIKYPNPLNLTNMDFHKLDTIACKYPTSEERANISSVGVSCGLVQGAGQRLDGKNALFLESNTPIRTPMYMCATATKAVIRKVKFRFNGTRALSGLRVDSIMEKNYNHREEMPLWGVERLNNFSIQTVRPLWGIVSPEVAARDDISHIQREHLWLPGYNDFVTEMPIGDTSESNMPGNIFYKDVAQYIYYLNPSGKHKITYTGLDDVTFYSKWVDLSRDFKGVQQMMNLLWTDVSANLVVGTKSWLPSSQKRHAKWSTGHNTTESTIVPVYIISRQVSYHMLYGIPAIIVLVITLLVMGFTLFLIIMRRTGPSKMRLYLSLTSYGRMLGSLIYPGARAPSISTDQWIETVGSKQLRLAVAMMAKKLEEPEDITYHQVPIADQEPRRR
ncbi:hypothetical protein FQN49_004553 [Arthroderma sp. PD_2]|nr:hypothetical protein FQN49_004553 [Arthroderma sp. PD_2]